MESILFPQNARPVTPILCGIGYETRIVIETSKRTRKRDFLFLLAKMRYEPIKITENNIMTFHELFEWIIERNHCHNGKVEFNGIFAMITNMKFFLKYLYNSYNEDRQVPSDLFLRFPAEFSGYILDAYQYYGQKNSEYLKFEPFIRVISTKPKKRKLAYIGVGYKDKGTAGDKSFDGTPDLKEFYGRYLPDWCYSSQYYSLEHPPNLGLTERINII
jgi:hypothetical protein